ncbi:hypothetical protein GB928_018790 [Shinella curvata]|uniref:Transposase n=1 Tax=Shinella curvata TaxID=1817964 RepID=A0ABT8XHM5_9HYPH|nr:hypothetical protein [Shinella curvata]MCJ8053908.1 hypothetical protein [Shinella curvata]MDO6123240.1 hypothetical protein [Shinella curvata]
MTTINIHPAVALQEDAALIDFLKDRNLKLAHLAREQGTLLSALGQERDGLLARVSDLEAKVIKLATDQKKRRPRPKKPEAEG